MFDPRLSPFYGWSSFGVLAMSNLMYFVDKYYYMYVVTDYPNHGLFTHSVMIFREWLRSVISIVSYAIMGTAWCLTLIPWEGRWTMFAAVATANVVV